MKAERARYVIGNHFEATVERIVPGGLGLVRGPLGIVLVEGAAPGDRAEIEVDAIRGGAPRGRIVALLQSGPGRTDPPCPFVGSCGGCDFQHLTYDAQFEAKQQIVADSLARIGGMAMPDSIELYPAPNVFGARTRVELHVDRVSGAIGFFGRHSQDIVDVDRCLVSRAEINLGIDTIRRSRQPLPASIQMLAAPGVVRSVPPLPPIEGGSFWLRIGEFEYQVDPASFFQSSLDLLPRLIATVTGSARERRRLAWDLYAGAGLFSLPLARTFDQVIGIDSDTRAINYAAESAKKNGIENAGFVASDVTRWIIGRSRGNARPDLVVVDPPRSGLGTELSKVLAGRNPAQLTYVSCDPTTLARDLRILTAGSLQIAGLAIFDLFPQTHHVETVVRLEAA